MEIDLRFWILSVAFGKIGRKSKRIIERVFNNYIIGKGLGFYYEYQLKRFRNKIRK